MTQMVWMTYSTQTERRVSDLDNGSRGGRMFVLAITGKATSTQIMRRVHRLANFYRDKGHFAWATGFVGGAIMTLNGTYRTYRDGHYSEVYTDADRHRL